MLKGEISQGQIDFKRSEQGKNVVQGSKEFLKDMVNSNLFRATTGGVGFLFFANEAYKAADNYDGLKTAIYTPLMITALGASVYFMERWKKERLNKE